MMHTASDEQRAALRDAIDADLAWLMVLDSRRGLTPMTHRSNPAAETQRSSHANGSDEKDDPVAA